MDGTALLWSSPAQALAGPLGIVEAPTDRLLFILGRPAPRPQPGDITVWTYDKQNRTVTDTLSLAAVLGISYDDKTLVLTEGWNGAGYEAPYAPLHFRPHILSNGRWAEGSKEYTAQNNRYREFSTYYRRFIARLHLECKSDIYGCRYYEDVVRALKEIKADRKLNYYNEDRIEKDRITILDDSKLKYIGKKIQ